MSKSFRKIIGRRAVMEALRSKDASIEKVLLARGVHGSIMQDLLAAAEQREIPVEWMERRSFNLQAGEGVNQGVMALVKSHAYTDFADMLDALQNQSQQALLVLTDEIEDPRNLGAIARTAEGAGAQGLIITAHRSSEVTAISEKAAGGAFFHLPVARVVNLANTLRDLKAAGVWIAGLDAEEGQTLWQADFKRPLALVIGNEGKGLRRLTRELCDFLVKIPMQGQVNSLNASVATGIALYEAMRQRQDI